MYLSLNREIMRWFDCLYEERRYRFDVDNFTFYLREGRGLHSNILSIKKKNSDYWMLEFALNEGYVERLRKNVHPVFNEYIYDTVSIYMDDVIYNRLNEHIIAVFDNVISLDFAESHGGYTMSFDKRFIDLAKSIEYNIPLRVAENLYITANSDKDVSFTNNDNTVSLRLGYEPYKGENMIDSLIDLRRSLVFYR